MTGKGIGRAGGVAPVELEDVAAYAADRGRPRLDRWARTAPRIAWALWAIGLALRLSAIWIVWRATEIVPVVFGVGMPTLMAADLMGFVTSTVGAIIVSRAPRNPIGWLATVGGIAQGILVVASWYAATAYTADPGGPAAAVGSISGSALQALALGVGTLFVLLFPTGRPLTPRWGLIVPVVVLGILLRFFDALLGPTYLYMLPTVPNPFHEAGPAGDALRFSWGHGLGFIVLLVSLGLASASVLLRTRRADEVLRRQIAWFAYAGACVFVGALPFAYYVLVVYPTTTQGEWAVVLFFIVLSLPSLAAAVAILRYRLFEIDRIVNRTVLYVGLSAILAGVVAAAISLTQRAFVAVTGETSDIAWVFTALIATATYTPVRKWLEGVVDRRLRYAPPFAAFRGELVEVLGVLAPERAARRLADDAVTDLGAAGAVVELDRGTGPSIVVVAGETVPSAAVLTVPIESEGRLVGRLLVGPRRDGRPYDADATAAVDEAVRLVGEALGPRMRPLSGG